MAGRTALITGASRGIGRAIALRCAEEGAQLFLTATKRALLEENQALAEAQGARVTLHCADLSRHDEALALVHAALAAMGGIDILVNNAGVYKAARLLDTSAEDFDRVMRVNVYGLFRVMQRVLCPMQPRKIADLALYLASAESDGMTGQSLLLDGGMLMVERLRPARPWGECCCRSGSARDLMRSVRSAQKPIALRGRPP